MNQNINNQNQCTNLTLQSPVSVNNGNAAVYFIIVVGAAVLLCLPFFRAIFWTGDEGVLLDAAQRMYQGETLYVDFFEMLPPAGLLLTEGWFHIFGLSLWSARLFAVTTIVFIACFIYLSCWIASRNAPLSAILAVGWILVTEPRLALMSVNHHWLTTLFLIASVSCVLASIAQPHRWLLWPLSAGLSAGVAVMVIETRGAETMLAGALVFLNLRKYRREFVIYCLGSVSITIGLIIYLISNNSIYLAYEDVIRLALEQYASIQSIPFGEWSSDATVTLKYLFPFVALLTVIILVNDWKRFLRDRMLLSCIAFGVASFMGCYPRPDVFHIAESVPLACPLLAYMVNSIVRGLSPYYRGAVLGAAIVFVAPAARSYVFQSIEALSVPAKPTPRGDAVFLGQPGTAEVLERIATMPASDRFFFYPYMPMMPFLSAREQVSKINLFIPQFTTVAQYQQTCRYVIQQATWVVIDRHWTDPAWLHYVFPAMRNTRPQETQRFEQALETGFELVAREWTFELRRRREGISDALCDDIAGEPGS